MKRHPIQSSNLKSVGYDENSSTLEVEFLYGAVYQYYNVPKQIFQWLFADKDPGRFFYTHIRSSFQYKRIDPTQASTPYQQTQRVITPKIPTLVKKSFYDRVRNFFLEPEKPPIAKPLEPTKTPRSISQAPARILDISTVIPSTIERPREEPEAKNWKEVLQLPYERADLQISQIKTEVLRCYEALCNFIDKKLIQHNTSLNRLRRQVERDNPYYGNILYTIYCIAEGEVTSHYKKQGGYENGFSYDLLTKCTNAEFTESVRVYCRKHCSYLPLPEPATLAAYNLTPNGLRQLWWDRDGTIREKLRLNELQIKLLTHTPARGTAVMEISEVRAEVFKQYLKAMDILREAIKTEEGWPKRLLKYLQWLLGQSSPYIFDQNAIKVPSYILKLCEQTVRENTPYMRVLNTTEEVSHLKRVLPKEAFESILKIATTIQEPIQFSDATIEILRAQNPSSWKKNILQFASCTSEQCVEILNIYRLDSNFKKIVKEAIKYSSGNTANTLLCCFAYCTALGEDDSENAVARTIKKCIPNPAQEAAFFNLVKSDYPLELKLINQLVELTKPPVRTVSLDSEKIKMAHSEHAAVVNRVEGYLEKHGTEGSGVTPQPTVQKEIIPTNPTETVPPSQGIDSIRLTNEQLNFLRLVTECDYELTIEDAEVFTKTTHKPLSSLIQGINRLCYSSIEDQLLEQNNDTITVDTIYRTQVKQIIEDNHAA